MTILFQKLISVIISYEQQFYIESKNWKYWKTVNKPVVNIWKISYQGTRLKISLFYCETSHYLPFFRVHVSFFSKIIFNNCRLHNYSYVYLLLRCVYVFQPRYLKLEPMHIHVAPTTSCTSTFIWGIQIHFFTSWSHNMCCRWYQQKGYNVRKQLQITKSFDLWHWYRVVRFVSGYSESCISKNCKTVRQK